MYFKIRKVYSYFPKILQRLCKRRDTNLAGKRKNFVLPFSCVKVKNDIRHVNLFWIKCNSELSLRA